MRVTTALPTAIKASARFTASLPSFDYNPVFVVPIRAYDDTASGNLYFVDNTGSITRRSNSFSNKSKGR